MNSLSRDVMNELQTNLDKASQDSSINGSVIISGKPNCFIAGADISMLQACKTAEEVHKISRDGQSMLNQVERSSKPVVAAIMGSCLGGGLEVRMLWVFNYLSVISFKILILNILIRLNLMFGRWPQIWTTLVLKHTNIQVYDFTDWAWCNTLVLMKNDPIKSISNLRNRRQGTR